MPQIYYVFRIIFYHRCFYFIMIAIKKTSSRYQIDMCSGPLLHKIIMFSIPLIFAGLLQLLFNTVDLIVIGRFASYQALAAVGATTSLTHLLICICLGISIGTNVLVARYIGAKQRTDVSRSVHTAIAFSVIAGVVAGVIGIIAARPVLVLMNTPEEIIDMSVLYMRLIFSGMPVQMLYNFGSAVLRAAGDTKRPFYFLVFGGVINVLLNLFFVLVCKWDVGGVAVATVISQAVAALLVLRVLINSRDICRIKYGCLKIHWSYLREMLRIGVPTGFQTACFSFANLWIQTELNAFGPEALAGSTASVTWEAIVFLFSTAIGQAGVSFVSQNYGGKQYTRIRRTLKYCTLLAVIFTVAADILFIMLAKDVLGLFNQNPDVIAWGIRRFRVILPFQFLCSFQEIVVSALRGLGHVMVPTIVMIFSICILRLIWVLTIYQMNKAFEMLLATYPLSWLCATVINSLYLWFIMKKLPRKDQITG